jgi:hypothetical protein
MTLRGFWILDPGYFFRVIKEMFQDCMLQSSASKSSQLFRWRAYIEMVPRRVTRWVWKKTRPKCCTNDCSQKIIQNLNRRKKLLLSFSKNNKQSPNGRIYLNHEKNNFRHFQWKNPSPNGEIFAQSGTGVMIFKILFAEKIGENWRSWLETKLSYAKIRQ